MEKIKHIEIKNFKSIRHVKIDECRKINVFIGYPNVGKSNILEALGLFCVENDKFFFHDAMRFEETSTVFFNGSISEAAEIKLDEQARIRLKYDGSFLKFERHDNRSYIAAESESKAEKNNQIKYVNRPAIAFNYNTTTKKFEDFRGTWTAFEAPTRRFLKYDFKKSVDYERNQSQTLAMPFGENIFDVISSNDKLRASVSQLFEFYNMEILFDSREQKFTILKRTKQGIFTIPYKLVADTLQRLIFFEAAVLSNQNSILIFEEPEAHMFPPYIKKLTGELLSDKTNQYFIATHSPYVLDELILEAGDDLSVYLVGYEDGETMVRGLSHDELIEVRQYGIDLFFNLESYLENGQVHHS
ncbi:MAG: hypothetical protein EAY75_14425 [Bacteroidetes bacterium]|nr:MAG: hypothetical protein EAY75_14425 [Bacteroidota bacterium]